MSEVLKHVAEIPSEHIVTSSKKPVLQTIFTYKRRIIVLLCIAGIYELQRTEPHNEVIFSSVPELKNTIEQVLHRKITWNDSYPSEYVAIPVSVKTEKEVEVEKNEAHSWITTKSLDWVMNYQCTHLPDDKKDCNDHAITDADVLHKAGITCYTVSLKPIREKDVNMPWHQVTVIQAVSQTYIVLDCNHNPTVVHGSLESHFAMYKTPMMPLYFYGYTKHEVPVHQNPVSRLLVQAGTPAAVSSMKSVVQPELLMTKQ